MEIGEIMNLNWNRISMLSKINKKNDIQQAEWKMRIAFQNSFSNAQSEERESIAKSAAKTLDDKMIKFIRSGLKKK